MKYSFRPNLFQKHFGVQLGTEQLELINAQGHVMNSIRLCDILNIHLLDCGNVRGSEDARHAMEHCTIRSKNARPILIKSGSYAGPSEWDDHGPIYRQFRSNLIDAVARLNPTATVTMGSRALVVIWRILQTCFAVIFVVGLGILFNMWREGNLDKDSLSMAALCILGGIGGYGLSGSFASKLRPSTLTIKEARENQLAPRV